MISNFLYSQKVCITYYYVAHRKKYRSLTAFNTLSTFFFNKWLFLGDKWFAAPRLCVEKKQPHRKHSSLLLRPPRVLTGFIPPPSFGHLLLEEDTVGASE